MNANVINLWALCKDRIAAIDKQYIRARRVIYISRSILRDICIAFHLYSFISFISKVRTKQPSTCHKSYPIGNQFRCGSDAGRQSCVTLGALSSAHFQRKQILYSRPETDERATL